MSAAIINEDESDPADYAEELAAPNNLDVGRRAWRLVGRPLRSAPDDELRAGQAQRIKSSG